MHKCVQSVKTLGLLVAMKGIDFDSYDWAAYHLIEALEASNLDSPVDNVAMAPESRGRSVIVEA